MSYKIEPINLSFSKNEIIANSVVHGIGVGLSIVGLVFLIIKAVGHGTAWHIVGFSVFGTSLLLLYLTSTVYHMTPNKAWNGVMQRLDHAAIYLLIAGTYTPFVLITLRTPLGWTIFGLVWGITIIGFILKLGFRNRFSKPPVGIYLLMGWLVIFVFSDVVQNLGATSMAWLMWGGALYTGGIAFYLWKKLPYSHAVWHAFVLGGSIFHYFSVMSIL